MDDKKKKYVVPQAVVVDFTNEDIITASLEEQVGAAGWDVPEAENF